MNWYQLMKVLHFLGLIALFGFLVLASRAGAVDRLDRDRGRALRVARRRFRARGLPSARGALTGLQPRALDGGAQRGNICFIDALRRSGAIPCTSPAQS